MLLGHRQLSDTSLKYFIGLFLRREFECEFEFKFVYLVFSSTIFWLAEHCNLALRILATRS